MDKREVIGIICKDKNGNIIPLDDIPDDPQADYISKMDARATMINLGVLTVKEADELYGYCFLRPSNESVCNVCMRHNKNKPWTCAAFPDAIPIVILMGGDRHLNPVQGDHGKTFDPDGEQDDFDGE